MSTAQIGFAVTITVGFIILFGVITWVRLKEWNQLNKEIMKTDIEKLRYTKEIGLKPFRKVVFWLIKRILLDHNKRIKELEEKLESKK